MARATISCRAKTSRAADWWGRGRGVRFGSIGLIDIGSNQGGYDGPDSDDDTGILSADAENSPTPLLDDFDIYLVPRSVQTYQSIFYCFVDRATGRFDAIHRATVYSPVSARPDAYVHQPVRSSLGRFASALFCFARSGDSRAPRPQSPPPRP